MSAEFTRILPSDLLRWPSADSLTVVTFLHLYSKDPCISKPSFPASKKVLKSWKSSSFGLEVLKQVPGRSFSVSDASQLVLQITQLRKQAEE